MAKDDLEQPLAASDEQIASPDQSDEKLAQNAVYDPSAPIEDLAEGDEAPAESKEFGSAEYSEDFEDETDPDLREIEATESLGSEDTDGDSYLDDDEEWGASSDKILHQDEDTAIAQQEDAVVSWDIQGLYDETGKVRGKRSLRNNPPMLVISDSLGENATFVLTKNLSGILARHFDNTYRAYYGIRPKDELSFKEKLSDAKTELRNNMGKLIIVGGILLGLLIFGFFF